MIMVHRYEGSYSTDKIGESNNELTGISFKRHMQGLTLQLDKKNGLQITLQPSEVKGVLDAKNLVTYVKSSQYSNLMIFEDKLLNVVALYNESKNKGKSTPIVEPIGEVRQADITVRVSDDAMIAFMAITAPHGGELPSYEQLVTKAKQSGIVRGLSSKRLKKLALWCESAQPGESIDELIAKSLPAREGRSSKVKPLVPNALERILKPQKTDNSKVNMRNLGDVICVKIGTKLLHRIPPTDGRKGYTVTGENIEPHPGSWLDLVPGDGTEVSPDDENYLIAAINGMPKFKEGQMWVDDTFICPGVNVGSGNIKYNGAVLVNGDVTENMTIEAEGDVTVNGFVESAMIEAGGDIIITEGAMGKVSGTDVERTTHLKAKGSVYVQHAQGICIKCNGNVNIGKQLAYSEIDCGGSVVVGNAQKPQGKLFACKIKCKTEVSAGILGAVSGSQLSIDYSEAYNDLIKRRDILSNVVKQLEEHLNRHRDKLGGANIENCPPHLQQKLKHISSLYNEEERNYTWLKSKLEILQQEKNDYSYNLKVVAYNKIFPGVSVTLNTKTWRAEREYRTAKIAYLGHVWKYEPMQ
jgi:uncharacterized protein (DUF342 family)